MRSTRPVIAVLILAAAVLWPAAAVAQPVGNYTVGLMVGLGGSADNDPDTGLDNFSWQGLFEMDLEAQTRFAARLGQIDLEVDEADGQLDGELTYLTVAGQYSFPAGYYESGLYLGLGLYDFSGAALAEDDTGLGVVFGVTGDFPIRERFGVRVELSGHWADLDYADFFAIGHVGVSYRF